LLLPDKPFNAPSLKHFEYYLEFPSVSTKSQGIVFIGDVEISEVSEAKCSEISRSNNSSISTPVN
jgi:hypothetical protein